MACYNLSKVSVYSANKRHKFNLDTRQELDPESESKPIGVVVNDDGVWFVTDCTCYVKMFSPEGAYEGKWGTSSCSSEEGGALCGLAMDAKGNLLIGDLDLKCIKRHRQDGSQVAKIMVAIEPWYLAATSQETIVVSDTVMVCIVDTAGHVLHTLKQKSMYYGVSVCDDIIYVCDSSNSEIICFSVSAEYIGSISVTDMPHSVTMVKEQDDLFTSTSGKVCNYKREFPLCEAITALSLYET